MDVFYADARESIQECRQLLHQVREEYQATQAIFQEKYLAMLKIYPQYQKQQKVDEIFQLLEDVKKLSQRVEHLMHKKDFRGAIEQLKFMDTMLYKKPLSELNALDEMRANAMKQLEKCHCKIINEMDH